MLHPTEEEGRGMDGYGQQTSSKLEDAEETEGEGSGEIVGMKCRAPLKEVSANRMNSLCWFMKSLSTVLGSCQLPQRYGPVCGTSDADW